MFTKRNILTAEQRAKGRKNRWLNTTQEERLNHSTKMNQAQDKGGDIHLDIEMIIGELEGILKVAKANEDAQTAIRAINSLGQWHRLKEYKASKGNQPATELPDIDPGTIAELEKNALARERHEDDEKLN